MVTLGLGNWFRIQSMTFQSITRHTFQLQDITFGSDNKSVAYSLKHSKTDQEGRGIVINIKPAYEHLCPVLSLCNFLYNRPKALGSIYWHVNGAPITCYQPASVLIQSLVRLDLDTHFYKLHSFRIWAATDAWSSGKKVRSRLLKMVDWPQIVFLGISTPSPFLC